MKILLRIFNFPPVIYVGLYFLLIPFFTMIYLSNSDGLYQSTVAQEGTIELHEKRIKACFEEYLSYGSQFLSKKQAGVQLDSQDFIYHEFDIEIQEKRGIKLSFVFEIICLDSHVVTINNLKRYEILSTGEVSAVMPYFQLADIGKFVPKPIPLFIEHKITHKKINPIIEQKENNKESLTAISPCPKAVGNSYQLEIAGDARRELVSNLKQYAQAVEGTPTSLGSNIIRMIYFSTITITTLGYGDIVPLTNTTRILVSLESFLGVILIGLFLNSLSPRKRLSSHNE